MRSSRGRLAVAAAVTALCTAAVMGQEPPHRPSAQAVSVEFFASGPDGVVFDLRPDELTLKVNGRARQIRSLRYVSLPGANPAGVATEPLPELEAPYGSNVLEGAGRRVTIVVDHESIRPGAEKNVMNSAVRFLNALGPRDQVSYVTMPNGGVEIEFTTDHARVVAALRKFVGRAPRESSEQERSCRSRLVLNGMRDLLREVSPLDGPKVVVLLSSGVLNPRRDAAANAPPGPCEISLTDFHELRTAAALARGYVFVVQPDDLQVESATNAFVDPTLSRFSAADKDRAGLESLAGAAAGEFFRIVGPDDTALPNVARSTAGYYVATFEPDDNERNGLTHRVELGLGRDSVRIRTRPEVLIPKPSARRASAEPREMLRDSVLYSALPLRTVAYASASAGGKVKIMAVVEPTERGVKLASAVFGLIDDRNQLVVQWTANTRELATLPLVAAGEAVPGPYRLRVAAVDTSGRSGSAEYDLVARLTEAGPLLLSTMAVGTSRDGGFIPKLVFGTDQAAVVFFETYGLPPKADSLTVRLELATSPEERALTTAIPRIVTASDDRRMVIGALPIAPLAPGDYTIRAIISLDGRPVGRVSRTLRKTASGS